MPNYLKMPKKLQILALLEFGWSYRRIEAETGVRRETVSRYDGVRLANAAKAFPGSDASPPIESPDLAAAAAANAAKTFAARPQTRPKRSPARRRGRALPPPCTGPRSRISWTQA